MPSIPNLPTSPSLDGSENIILSKAGTTYKSFLSTIPVPTSVTSALSGKANTAHTHPLSDITASGATGGQVISWSGSAWIATNPVTGVTDHTLLTNVGTNTHSQIDSHISSTSNPHTVTKSQVGLGSVDNTTDLLKPISTATAAALTGKASTVHTHALTDLLQGGATSGQSIVWNGTSWAAATVSSGGGGVTDHFLLTNIGINTHSLIDAHLASTTNPHSVTKTQVGLSNVDNTTDAAKPISGATQTALDLKANIVTTVSAQTGTTYTLLTTDNNKIITFNNASDITLTVPAGLGSGYSVVLIQLGLGEIILSASGVTINNRQSFTKSANQFAVITLISYASNVFVSSGDMI